QGPIISAGRAKFKQLRLALGIKEHNRLENPSQRARWDKNVLNGLDYLEIISMPIPPPYRCGWPALGYSGGIRSVADLTFLPASPRVLRRNVKSKATLEPLNC